LHRPLRGFAHLQERRVRVLVLLVCTFQAQRRVFAECGARIAS
jgi:hypothetical protein